MRGRKRKMKKKSNPTLFTSSWETLRLKESKFLICCCAVLWNTQEERKSVDGNRSYF